jgi:hypothetical protein
VDLPIARLRKKACAAYFFCVQDQEKSKAFRVRIVDGNVVEVPRRIRSAAEQRARYFGRQHRDRLLSCLASTRGTDK